MNAALGKYCFLSRPMPSQGICRAERMHRLFLLTLEYAESELCVGVMHLENQ